jgi:hypothetical protein
MKSIHTFIYDFLNVRFNIIFPVTQTMLIIIRSIYIRHKLAQKLHRNMYGLEHAFV